MYQLLNSNEIICFALFVFLNYNKESTHRIEYNKNIIG